MHLDRRTAAFALLLASLVTASALHASDAKVPLTTSSEKARAASLHARDLSERLRIQEARPLFEQAVAADPKFAVAWLGLANTQPSAKQFFEKLAQAKGTAGGASAGEQLLIRGADAGARGANADQVKVYEELVASFPDDERAQ